MHIPDLRISTFLVVFLRSCLVYALIRKPRTKVSRGLRLIERLLGVRQVHRDIRFEADGEPLSARLIFTHANAEHVDHPAALSPGQEGRILMNR